MRAGDIGDRGARAFCHLPLVSGGMTRSLCHDHRWAASSMQRWWTRWYGAQCDRPLARHDQPPVLRRQVLGEGVVYRVRLQERLGVALWSARVTGNVRTLVGSGTSSADPDPPRI